MEIAQCWRHGQMHDACNTVLLSCGSGESLPHQQARFSNARQLKFDCPLGRRCFANGDKNEMQCRTQSNPSLSAGRAKHPKAKLVPVEGGRLSINSKLARLRPACMLFVMGLGGGLVIDRISGSIGPKLDGCRASSVLVIVVKMCPKQDRGR